MEKRDVEKKLNDAVNNAIPSDMRERIIANCKDMKKTEPLVIHNHGSRKKEKVLSFVAFAAIMFITCGVLLNLYDNAMRNKVDIVVDIDVNPSIELKINANDRVVDVRAINDDAIAILDGMDLKGTQTKVAVNAIIGSMFEHGYLKGETNTLLVSVDGKNERKIEEVQQHLTDDINRMLQSYSNNASVIGQIIVKDAEIEDIVEKYNISEGKAALIKKIVAADLSYSIEDLVELNITELNEIIDKLSGLTVSEGTLIEINDDSASVNNVELASNIPDDIKNYNNEIKDDSTNNSSDKDSDDTYSEHKDKKKKGNKKKDKKQSETVSDNGTTSDNNIEDDEENAEDTKVKTDDSKNEQVSSDNPADESKDNAEEKDNSDTKTKKDDKAASDNSISDNSISDNSISDNSISDNSISDNSVNLNSEQKDADEKNEDSESDSEKNIVQKVVGDVKENDKKVS